MRRFEMIANRVVEAVKFDTRKEMQEYKREHHPEQGTKLQLRTDQELKKRREERVAGIVVPFVVTVQGKIKQNVVAAESEEQAVEIFDSSYPKFAGVRKTVVRVVRSGLLF